MQRSAVPPKMLPLAAVEDACLQIFCEFWFHTAFCCCSDGKGSSFQMVLWHALQTLGELHCAVVHHANSVMNKNFHQTRRHACS